MSRGPGIQKAIEEALKSSLDKVWSTRDLALRAYPGEPVTPDRTNAVRRAADIVAGQLGWRRQRSVGITEYCSRDTAERIKRQRAELNAQIGLPDDVTGAHAVCAQLCQAVRRLPPDVLARADRQAEILLARQTRE